jgi:hypothetical protein
VDKLNELRAIHADRFLFAQVEETWILELGQRYKDSGIKLTAAGFGPAKRAKTTVGRK